MRTVSYLRVSTLRQEVERQEDTVKNFNKDMGNEVIAEFIEKESGLKDDRQQLKLMLEFCSSPTNQVEQVVVDMLSRLGRTRYVLDVIEKLNYLKINLHSVKEMINTLNDDYTINRNAALLTGLLSSINQFELSTIQHQMKTGKKTAVKNGQHWGGSKLPFGYTKEGKKLIIDPVEAETIKLIFSEYLAGFSFFQISKKLNRSGIKSKMGLFWADGPVNRILKNPIYKGVILYKDEYYQLPHLGVISETDWDKVQSMISKAVRPANHKIHTYKLNSGKIICGVCGAYFSPINNKDQYSYSCVKRAHKYAGMGKRCNSFGIGITKLTNSIEDIIAKNFVHILLNSIDQTEIDQKIQTTLEAIDDLKQSIKKSEKDESKLLDLGINNPGITREIFEQKLLEIQSNRIKLKNNLKNSSKILEELQRIKVQKNDIKSFADDIKANGISKEILNRIVTRIIIYPADVKLTHRVNDNAVRVVLQMADKELAFHVSPFSNGYDLIIQRMEPTVASSILIYDDDADLI